MLLLIHQMIPVPLVHQVLPVPQVEHHQAIVHLLAVVPLAVEAVHLLVAVPLAVALLEGVLVVVVPLAVVLHLEVPANNLINGFVINFLEI